MNEPTYLNPVSSTYISAASLHGLAFDIADLQDTIEKMYGVENNTGVIDPTQWQKKVSEAEPYIQSFAFTTNKYNHKRDHLLRTMYQIINDLEYQYSREKGSSELGDLVKHLKQIRGILNKPDNTIQNVTWDGQNFVVGSTQDNDLQQLIEKMIAVKNKFSS